MWIDNSKVREGNVYRWNLREHPQGWGSAEEAIGGWKGAGSHYWLEKNTYCGNCSGSEKTQGVYVRVRLSKVKPNTGARMSDQNPGYGHQEKIYSKGMKRNDLIYILEIYSCKSKTTLNFIGEMRTCFPHVQEWC